MVRQKTANLKIAVLTSVNAPICFMWKPWRMLWFCRVGLINVFAFVDLSLLQVIKIGSGLVARSGIPSQVQVPGITNGGELGNWALTQINMTPVSLNDSAIEVSILLTNTFRKTEKQKVIQRLGCLAALLLKSYFQNLINPLLVKI